MFLFQFLQYLKLCETVRIFTEFNLLLLSNLSEVLIQNPDCSSQDKTVVLNLFSMNAHLPYAETCCLPLLDIPSQ